MGKGFLKNGLAFRSVSLHPFAIDRNWGKRDPSVAPYGDPSSFAEKAESMNSCHAIFLSEFNSFLAKPIRFFRVARKPSFFQRNNREDQKARIGMVTELEKAPTTGPGSEKYQRILDAAVAVIAERGYFHSPISAIAKRAGVADGTVYLYFKNKDDVLRTAIDATFDRFYKKVEESFETLKGPREQLEYIAEVHLESHRENRSMAILMQTEVRQSAKFIAEFSHHHLVKYIQMVREVVRRGQQEGVFRRDVSDGVVAHCMFGAIDELLSSAVFTGRVYDSKTTARQVIDVLLNGIAAE